MKGRKAAIAVTLTREKLVFLFFPPKSVISYVSPSSCSLGSIHIISPFLSSRSILAFFFLVFLNRWSYVRRSVSIGLNRQPIYELTRELTHPESKGEWIGKRTTRARGLFKIALSSFVLRNTFTLMYRWQWREWWVHSPFLDSTIFICNVEPFGSMSPERGSMPFDSHAFLGKTLLP